VPKRNFLAKQTVSNHKFNPPREMRSRFPSGLTTRKATARARTKAMTTADPYGMTTN
jgi:hypothetical protein